MRALAAAGRLATGPGNRGRDPHVLAVALVALLAARQGCGAAAGRAFARRVQGRVGGRLRALRGGAAGVAKALGGQALGRAADPVLEGVAGLGGLAAGACEELGAFPADGRWGEGARGALAPALEAAGAAHREEPVAVLQAAWLAFELARPGRGRPEGWKATSAGDVVTVGAAPAARTSPTSARRRGDAVTVGAAPAARACDPLQRDVEETRSPSARPLARARGLGLK
ncbi:unnamed protein product, partial [Prorocentrum cordatum]